MVDIVGYDEAKKKKITCSNCTAILTYSPKEVRQRIECDYGGGRDTVSYITCPGCSAEVPVRGY